LAKPFPVNPPHPERNCWGCDRYCGATVLLCGNGSERTQHPAELFGPDWLEWIPPSEAIPAPAPAAQAQAQAAITLLSAEQTPAEQTPGTAPCGSAPARYPRQPP